MSETPVIEEPTQSDYDDLEREVSYLAKYKGYVAYYIDERDKAISGIENESRRVREKEVIVRALMKKLGLDNGGGGND